ncbi:MAG: aromatic amino acid DMT transporter YddG [Chloroflexi bacterium]|nr:aromatic amino acid DMT transporter YddG [Chloroflexota bacterium]
MLPQDRHTLYGLAAILLWSSTVALARSLSEQLGPLTAAAAVYLLGGLAALGQSRLTGRLRRGLRPLPRRYLLGCGALFVFYMASFYLAIGLAHDHQQTLEIGLVNYLWPALTVLLSLPLLGQKARPTLLPATLLALLGVALVLTQGVGLSWGAVRQNVTGNPTAYVLALGAAVSWALYSTLTRRWAGPDSPGAVPVFLAAAGGAFLLLRLGWVERTVWSSRAAAETLFLALATSLAYGLWDAAMRRGNIILVAACSYFTPLISTLVSCLYLGVLAGPRLWVGAALLAVGSLASWASLRR